MIQPFNNIIFYPIITEVNAGPVFICETFFSKYEDFPKEQMESLRSTLINFLKACKEGLEVHEKIIASDSKMREFHEDLLKGN